MPDRILIPRVADRNVYLPKRAIVKDIVQQNELVRTLHIAFEDEIYNKDFIYQSGQFMMLSMPHCGEAPISFSSSPSRPGSFSLSVRRVGKLTNSVFELRPGDMVGVRGPYGRPFPMNDLAGRNLIFTAGGIGMAPLRSVIEFCTDNRGNYGDITVLYGCKSPGDFCFREELQNWDKAGLIKTHFTVDEACDEWNGCVGLVTSLLDRVEIQDNSTKALVCGPGVMIRFVFERLIAMGLPKSEIITTLERHMKCGVGICGNCHYEEKMICTDGPVFAGSEISNLETL